MIRCAFGLNWNKLAATALEIEFDKPVGRITTGSGRGLRTPGWGPAPTSIPHSASLATKARRCMPPGGSSASTGILSGPPLRNNRHRCGRFRPYPPPLYLRLEPANHLSALLPIRPAGPAQHFYD